MRTSITNLQAFAERMKAQEKPVEEAQDVLMTEPQTPLRLDADEMRVTMLAMRTYIKILRSERESREMTDKQRKQIGRTLHILYTAIGKIRNFNKS